MYLQELKSTIESNMLCLRNGRCKFRGFLNFCASRDWLGGSAILLSAIQTNECVSRLTVIVYIRIYCLSWA